MADQNIVVPDPVDQTVNGIAVSARREGGVTYVRLTYSRRGVTFERGWSTADGGAIPGAASLTNFVQALLAVARAEWGF